MEKLEFFTLSGFTCVSMDLRISYKEKMEIAKLQNTKWTVMVNRIGSLAHVVSKSGIIIRIENERVYSDEAHNINYFVRVCKHELKGN